MQSSLSLSLTPNTGERELQERLQRLLDSATSEPDPVSEKVMEAWQRLACLESAPPVVGELRLVLQRCVQMAALVDETAAGRARFKPLEEHQTQLQALANRVRLVEMTVSLAEPLQALADLYKNALVKQIVPPFKASLYIPGKGHYLISQSVARALASLTEWGEPVKKNFSGSNRVCHLHGVFYKADPRGETRFSPAMEFAVVALHQTFSLHTAEPTTCLKLRHIEVKKVKLPEWIEEKRRPAYAAVFQALDRHCKSGGSIDQFSEVSKLEGEPLQQECVLQAGLGMEGVSLELFLCLQRFVSLLGTLMSDKDRLALLPDLCGDTLILEIRKDYPAIFSGETILVEELLSLLIAFNWRYPPEKRLRQLQNLNDSPEECKSGFSSLIAHHGNEAGVWAFGLIKRFPQLMAGTQLEDLLLWRKGVKLLQTLRPTCEEQIAFALNWQKSLDPEATCCLVLSTLFSLPKDGKADNYIVHLSSPMKIVSIDNDIGLLPPLEREGRKTKSNLHCTLLFLEPLLSFSVPETLRQKLLSTSPETWILSWLISVWKNEQELNGWLKGNLLTSDDFDRCGVIERYPFGIIPEAALFLYERFKCLHARLQISSLTLKEIFQLLHPLLFKHYQTVGASCPDPIQASHREKDLSLEETVASESDPALKKLLEDERARHFSDPQPILQSVKALAKLFPWGERDERILPWLDQMGRVGLQEACLSKEVAQRLLPQAIKLSLPGAVQVLCCHEVNSVIEASTQQTVFHLFAHTYVDDKLTDEEALSIWKSLFTIKGANINGHYAGETLAVFTLFKRMVQKEARGVALLWEAMKHGLDVTLKCKEETLFMKALRLAEEDVRYRSPLHRLIPLGGAKGVPVERVVHYLVKSNDVRCQELLIQEEPGVAWRFTLNALAPTFTPKEASFNAKTCTEMRYFTQAMIKRCPEKFQSMVCGSSLSSTPPPERYGRHLVFPYEEGIHKVHMKVNPEIPGYEYAFQQLALLFFDEELPQHTLFRLEIRSSRFVPVLWSQTVPGENLQTLYKKDPVEAHQRLSQLEAVHVSRLICLTLLGLTEDGKPDNFIVQGRRLVSVDNDHAFIDAVTYPIKEGLPQPQLNLKSIVFCLDQMRQPLDPKVVKRITSWNLAESFKGWLEKLHVRHEALKAQFGMRSDELRAWSEAPADQTRIGILFEGKSFLDLYDRACRLQKCLRERPGMSGFELLRELLPTVHPFYERAFAHINPLDRFFIGIAEGRYLKSDGAHLTTLSNPVTFFSLKQLPKGSSFHTPSYCLGLLQGINAEAKQVNAILKEVQQGKIDALDRLRIPAHIEKVVNHLKFASLTQKQQLVLLDRLADPAKGIAFKKLRINSSPCFTDAHLLALLRTSPGLKQLIVSDCPLLTHVSIGEIARLAPTLQVLSLHKLPKLQNLASFYKPGAFSSKEPHFQGLLLLSCERLSVTECSELVSLRFSAPRLQSLTVNECPRLEIPSVVASIQRVPELKAIRLPLLPAAAYPPLFAALSRQRRGDALLQLLIQAYPKPQETLSLPGVNLTDILEACVPFFKAVSPKTLRLPATSLTPRVVTALLKASLYHTLVTFDPAAPIKSTETHTLQGHTSSVLTACQLADRRIVSGSIDNTLKVWDPVTLQCLANLQGHTGSVRTCCQLADGRIVSGSSDDTLKVWDPVSFHCLATLQGHTNKVDTCCQLADGRIVSGSSDSTLKVWDPATFHCLATLEGHKSTVSTACQLADGRIVSGSIDNTLKVWDPATFHCLATLEGHKSWVVAACQLADGRIVSGSSDDTLKVWDPVSFQCLVTLQGHTNTVETCCQLADGRIVSGSSDKTLKVWDPVTFQCLATLQGRASYVSTCCQLVDGRIVSGSSDKTLKVWDMEATSSLYLEAFKRLQHAAGWTEGDGWLALFWKAGSGAEEALWQSLVGRFCLKELYQEHSAEGRLSILGSSDSKSLRGLWEALRAPEELPMTRLNVVPASLKWTKALVAASPKLEHLELPWKRMAALPRSLPTSLKTLTLPVATSGEMACLATLKGHEREVYTACQLADGKILSGSADDTLKVWDPVSFRCLATLNGHMSAVVTGCQLADGRILSGSSDKTLRVWDPVSFQRLATLKGHEGGVWTACQLADGRILSGSSDCTMKVWDPVSFHCLATLKGHEREVWTACQLADGRILSGSMDKALRVWDPVSFHCLAILKGHEDDVRTACQLADGRVLSGSVDRTLKVWDPVSFQCLATLKGHEGKVWTACQLADGRIVSGSYDNTLKVWDPVSFQCLATLKGEREVWTACQLTDGRILSGSMDKTLRVWDVPYTKVTLRVHQLTGFAPQVRWQKGRLIGPRGVHMHLWFEQLQRVLEVCFPKVRLHAEGDNVFSVRGRDPWEDALVEKLVLLFAQKES